MGKFHTHICHNSINHPKNMSELVEEWKQYDEIHDISNMGNFRNSKSKEDLKTRLNYNDTKHRVISIKDRMITIGRAVLENFGYEDEEARPCKEGECCIHRNGDPQDDRRSNLKWGKRPGGNPRKKQKIYESPSESAKIIYLKFAEDGIHRSSETVSYTHLMLPTTPYV